jgi:hypothetical protein
MHRVKQDRLRDEKRRFVANRAVQAPDLGRLSLMPHTPLIHRSATPNAPQTRRSQSIEMSPVRPQGPYRPRTKEPEPRAAALPEREATPGEPGEPLQPPPRAEPKHRYIFTYCSSLLSLGLKKPRPPPPPTPPPLLQTHLGTRATKRFYSLWSENHSEYD